MSLFQPAQKATSKARIALAGPSGSGKTYTALAVATGLADGQPIALVDTEHGSASLFADRFTFDTAAMSPPYQVDKYKQAISEAEQGGYGVLIIDSLTHAWKGEGGVLDQVDAEKRRSGGGANDFSAWKTGDKLWRSLLDTILAADLHVIVTMRSKTEWVLEADQRGKQVPRKVGMAPEARDGIEYEFTLTGDVDHSHTLIVSKSRAEQFADAVIERPGRELGEQFLAWLRDGKPAADAFQPADPNPQPEGEAEPCSSLADDPELDALLTRCAEAGYELNRSEVHAYAETSAKHREAALQSLRDRLPQQMAEGGEPAPFDPITDEQMKNLLHVISQLPEPENEQTRVLQEAECGELAELSAQQADVHVDRLTKRLAEKQAREATKESA